MLYALVAIVAGVAAGYPAKEWSAARSGEIGILTMVAVFLVVYPMMINLRLEALAKAGRNARGLTLALAYNFLWAPLLGFVLARAFLDDPQLAIGFLLVMVVPCSSMSIAYTGLAKGDVELATVIVGASFVLAVVAVPVWMAVFAAGYGVAVPMGSLLGSILAVLIAPMGAGWLTRHAIVRRRGPKGLARLQPTFSASSVLAMFAIFFLIFFSKAEMIVERWQTVLLLMVPNILFMAVTLAVATWPNRRPGLDYREHMAVVSPPPARTTAPPSPRDDRVLTAGGVLAAMPIFQMVCDRLPVGGRSPPTRLPRGHAVEAVQ